MIRKARRPSFSVTDKGRLIAALAEAREEAIKYSSAHGFHSREHALVDKLATAIDDIAEHLTGDRELFWSKGFGYLATPAPGHKKG